MRTNEKAAIKSWMRANDLHVYGDVTSNCQCEHWCEHLRPIFAVRTYSDPSVGIFPANVSPWFASEDAALAWTAKNKSEVSRLLCEPA